MQVHEFLAMQDLYEEMNALHSCKNILKKDQCQLIDDVDNCSEWADIPDKLRQEFIILVDKFQEKVIEEFDGIQVTFSTKPYER